MQLIGWRHLKNYFSTSLWAVPILAIPFAMIATRALHWLDAKTEWTLLGFGVPGAQATLQAVVTASLSFLVFTFGSLLVAIQVASGQLTPRIIATTLLRNDVVRYTVALFMFTLLLAASVLGRTDAKVHQLPLFAAVALGVACFAAFLYLIDSASRLLRPITVLTNVGDGGIAVIKGVYPEPSVGPDITESRRQKLSSPDRVIPHRGTSSIVLSVDINALVDLAKSTGGVIEFVPQVGDFVAVDEPLFNLYGDARSIDADLLHSAVDFGSERTMEQDPTFAFRIVIDIALKALSPAINDPTTAVLAIDQLHRLLRSVGKRHLRTDEIAEAGHLRVIFRTPNWDDFVNLTFSEIRANGAGNLQIVRRLRAMIENLKETLPTHRLRELDKQLSLLDSEVQRLFRYPEELALARVGDSQGLGGRSSRPIEDE